MANEPTLPANIDRPQAVNGWQYDPEDTSNGHVWRANNCSVGLFDTLSAVTVRVTDDRVGGFASNVELERVTYDRDDRPAALPEALKRAREWMVATAPGDWSHPDVCEAVFDAPAGYSLESYHLENRETIIYYRRESVEETPLRGRGDGLEKLTAETAPFLYVHVWRGSGNATVALAPWLHAHGPSSRYPEVREIAETPEECGLEVAVTAARQFAREHIDVDGEDAESVGQSNLGQSTESGGETA